MDIQKSHSTAEAAKVLGISKKTLLRWLWGGKIAEPKQSVNMGRVDARIWTAADLERARAFKEQNYRKRS
jgi:predicted site-specific integrase-resolvase